MRRMHHYFIAPPHAHCQCLERYTGSTVRILSSNLTQYNRLLVICHRDKSDWCSKYQDNVDLPLRAVSFSSFVCPSVSPLLSEFVPNERKRGRFLTENITGSATCGWDQRSRSPAVLKLGQKRVTLSSLRFGMLALLSYNNKWRLQ